MRTAIRIAIGAALSLATGTALATGYDDRWFVSGQAGFAITNSEENDTGGEVVLTIGKGLYRNFAVTGFFQSAELDITVGPNNTTTTYLRNGLGVGAQYTVVSLGRTDINLLGSAILRRVEFLGIEQDGFSTQAGLGVAVDINSSLEFLGDVRYQVDYVEEEGPIGDSDYYTTGIQFGLRYKFGVWPPPPPDYDGDGVPNDSDRCPNTPYGAEVDVQGCALDSDGDGVPDFRDSCPNTAAGMMVSEDGCPLDSDGDGVIDIADRCPDTPQGAGVDTEGCGLDNDGDGVADAIDLCPGTPYGAEVDINGCPFDTDRDGVPDFRDSCPNSLRGEEVDEVGCNRDVDGDGVPNAEDACPTTPKGMTVDAVGCTADQDADGVPDNRDECPSTPQGTPVDSRGCGLDNDGDGVPDHRDNCPNTPPGRPVNEEGCSRDIDGDGVVNASDLCPNTFAGLAVDSSGCPTMDQRLVLDNVHFELARSDLLPDSRTLLRQLVASLKDQPTVRVEVAGHTDSQGDAAYNQRLSQARAESVRSFLIENGIPAENISARGYGEERPIAENQTPAGRALNRRVEIELLNL